MLRQNVTIDDVVDYLNSVAAVDREALSLLIQRRVPCNSELADHPTVQVGTIEGKDAQYEVGFLGLLNGLFGTIEGGEREGWGAIAAVFDKDGGSLTHFVRTDVEPSIA